MDNYWNNEEYNRVHGPGAGAPESHDEDIYVQSPAERLARTAIFMGISAIVTTFFMPIFVPGILAVMSITFAILSRGREQRMPRESRKALIFGTIGLVVYLAFMATAVTTVYRMITDPGMRQRSNEIMTQMYGYTMDDLLQAIDGSYGTDLTTIPEDI